MRIPGSVVLAVQIGLLCALQSSAPATTYVVRPEGGGDFPSIQAALNAVADGDRIELADGLFYGAGNYNLSYGGKGVTLASQSGNPATCVINCLAQGRGVSFTSSDGPDAVLQGITITGGTAPGGGIDVGGGGIRCVGGSPTIIGCVISANSTGRYGGGVRLDLANPVFRECVFVANEATEVGASGGGICAMDGSNPTFEDCSFESNTGWTGGGAYLVAGAAATFLRCRFVGNTAHASGGGLQSSDSPGATFIDCEFFENVANSEGGAIAWSGSVSGGSDLILQGCTFVRNTATVAYGGGAYVIASGGTLLVERCTFHGNSGLTAGGLYVHSNNIDVQVRNTIISGSGGASAYFWGPFAITCCDFFGNSGGDWEGALAPAFGVDGNIALDPRYCAPELDDLHLYSDSPCAPYTPPNPECDLIGAWGVACEPTPVEETSWGAVKYRFRPAR